LQCKKVKMRLIIGIDDTDNLESRGTGFRARELGQFITKEKLGVLRYVSRHQLFFHPEIPFTSHNSSASIVIDNVDDTEAVRLYCEKYLLEYAAEGSDAGLCIYSSDSNSSIDAIIEFSHRAKSTVVTEAEAYQLAAQAGMFLKGYTGLKTGIIGALSAVGLRVEGCDGRVLWSSNLRDTVGVYNAEHLKQFIDIDSIVSMNYQEISPSSLVFKGEWCRPIMLNNKVTLIVEEVKNEQYEWKIAPKEFIKSITQ